MRKFPQKLQQMMRGMSQVFGTKSREIPLTGHDEQMYPADPDTLKGVTSKPDYGDIESPGIRRYSTPSGNMPMYTQDQRPRGLEKALIPHDTMTKRLGAKVNDSGYQILPNGDALEGGGFSFDSRMLVPYFNVKTDKNGNPQYAPQSQKIKNTGQYVNFPSSYTSNPGATGLGINFDENIPGYIDHFLNSGSVRYASPSSGRTIKKT